MTMTPAERQRAYRQRQKAKAAAGDKHARDVIKRNKAAQQMRNYKSNTKIYLERYATAEELKKFQKIIKKRLEK